MQRQRRAEDVPPDRCRHATVILRVEVSVVAVVATEELVATVSTDDHFHAIAREGADVPGAQ